MSAPWVTAVCWIAFLASSVFGHVALKLATEGHELEGSARMWAIASSPWTIGGVLSWVLSGVLWIVILDRNRLFEAMSTSSVRYVLVLAAAVLWLRESVSTRQLIGAALIAVGVFLVQDFVR